MNGVLSYKKFNKKANLIINDKDKYAKKKFKPSRQLWNKKLLNKL